jgi:hypothetical protein
MSHSPTGAPVVVKTERFTSPSAAEQWLRTVRANYRRIDEYTGRKLFKTPANVVLRWTDGDTAVEILSNCVC